MIDMGPWSRWDLSAIKRWRMQMASGPWCWVMETPFYSTAELTLNYFCVCRKYLGFSPAEEFPESLSERKSQQFTGGYGGKQKGINSGSAVEKLLILLQATHAVKVKKGLREQLVNVISACLCDMWRAGNWSQPLKGWWNPVSSHNLKR